MNNKNITYVSIFIVISLGLLIALPPLMPRRIIEPFSEFGVLGSNMMLGEYPTKFTVGEEFDLYLYNGNEEGQLMYYRVFIKVGSENDEVSDIVPMDAPILWSFDMVLADGQNSTIPITLSLSEAGINRRLVFELYQYEPELNDFSYSGQWLQMWLNVTSE